MRNIVNQLAGHARNARVLVLSGILATVAACNAVKDVIIDGELGGTAWQVASIDAYAVPRDVSMTMSFGSDGTVSGSTGCNTYAGQSVWTASGINITRVAVTRMACPEPQATAEALFIAAVDEVDNYRLMDNGQLVIFGSDVRMTLNPAN